MQVYPNTQYISQSYIAKVQLTSLLSRIIQNPVKDLVWSCSQK